jgi:hypothetical protein
MLELESLDQTNSSPVNFMAMDLKSQRDIDCLFSRTTAVTVIKQVLFICFNNECPLLFFQASLGICYPDLFFLTVSTGA